VLARLFLIRRLAPHGSPQCNRARSQERIIKPAGGLKDRLRRARWAVPSVVICNAQAFRSCLWLQNHLQVQLVVQSGECGHDYNATTLGSSGSLPL
jgi:hypothetical protein